MVHCVSSNTNPPALNLWNQTVLATDVGAYAQSRTFYGTSDQGGNVQEWTEWTSEFQPLRNRRIRGGSWYYNEFYTGANDYEFDTTDYDSESIGFRVAGRVER